MIPKHNSRKGMFFLKKMQRINYVFLSLLEDKQQYKFGVVITGHLTLFLAYFLVGFSSKNEEY